MAYRSYGFDDARRRSSFRDREDVAQYDSYRPGDRGDRGELDRRDRPRDNSSPGRGGPDDRNERGPPSHLRPRTPSLNTDPAVLDAPTAPRGSTSHDGSRSIPTASRTSSISSATSKPASGESRNKQADTQSSAGDKLKRATGNTSSSGSLLPVKMKDPKLQPIFDIVCQLTNDVYWRCQIGPDRAKKKKEMERHAEEIKRFRAPDYPSLAEVHQRKRERDEKEMAYIETQWAKNKHSWYQHMEDLAVEISKSRHGQPPVTASTGPDNTALMQSLEKRFDFFREEIKQHKTMIEDLRRGKEESDAKLKDVDARLGESQAKVRELEAECKESNSKLKDVQQGLQKSGDQIKSLDSSASKASVQDQEKKALVKDVASQQKRVESLESTVNKLLVASDEFEKRLEEALKSLDNFAVVTSGMTNLTNRVEEIAHQLQAQEKSGAALTRRVGKAETGMKETRSALTQLQASMKGWDQSQLDDLLDAWSTLNMKSNFPLQRDRLEQLGAEVESIKKEVASSTLMASEANTTGGAVRIKLEEFQRIVDSTHDELSALKESSKSRVAAADPKEMEELRAVINSTRNDVQSIKESKSRVAPTDPGELAHLRTSISITSNAVKSIKESLPADPKAKFKFLEDATGNASKAMLLLQKRIGDSGKRLNETLKRNTTDALNEAAARVDELQKRVEELEDKQPIQAKAVIDMDGLSTRVTTLENNQRTQARTPASTPQLESQQSPVACDSIMVTRVKAIEDQNLSQRMEQLSTRLTESIKAGHDDHVKQLERIGASIRTMRTVYDGQIQEVRGVVQARVDQLQMEVQTLNQQFSHLNTKEMADAIFQQLDSYGQRVHRRVDDLQRRLDHLEALLKQATKPTSNSTPYGQRASQDKRSISPRANGSDANKRRRVEVNGHQSPS